ncbi:MAG TPA: hypothetical protein VGC85_06905, partial [Chthoniobacterales bacterium]
MPPQTSFAPLPHPPPIVPGQIFSTTSGAAIDTHGERRGFDFRHFWHSLVERLWIVVLCLLGGFFLSLGYLAKTPKLYQGHVVLEVDVQDPTPIRSEDPTMRLRAMFLASQEALRTIEQNLTNRGLCARVVRSENLAEDGGRALLGRSVTNDDAKKENAKATPKPAATAAPDSAATELVPQPTFTPLEDALGGAVARMIKPVIRRGTRLIDVYVVNQDPQMAQRLADAVGREYIRYSIERRS